MTAPDALPPEMRTLRFPLGSDPLSLDDHTLDGLVSGALGPDDAPPEYRGVAWLVRALTQPPTATELEVEAGAVAGITAAVASAPATTDPRRSSMLRTVTSAKRLAALSVAGGAILLGGLVTAGALPGAAQQAAADALDHVGITVPSPNEASNGHTDVRGKSAEHTTDQGAPTITPASTPPDTTSNGQGSEISQTARTTDATGVDKGAQISDQASNGQSHAGEEHPSIDVPPSVPASTPSQADNGLAHRP